VEAIGSDRNIPTLRRLRVRQRVRLLVRQHAIARVRLGVLMRLVRLGLKVVRVEAVCLVAVVVVVLIAKAAILILVRLHLDGTMSCLEQCM